jgi:hypothetical protein
MFLALTLAVTAGTASADGVAARTSTAPSPAWHAVPIKYTAGLWLSLLGTGSGRIWINAEDAQGYGVWSARLQGGRLTSFVDTAEGHDNIAFSESRLAGSSLLNCCVDQLGVIYPVSKLAPLLAAGGAGPWATIPGDPEQTAREAVTPAGTTAGGSSALAAVTSGGRTIWAISGAYCPTAGANTCTINRGGIGTLAACCTAAGGATNLGSLITNPAKIGPQDVTMRTDTRGRVWLAWLDSHVATVYPEVVNLVQLDPATLKPLSSKKLTTSVIASSVGSIFLACSADCSVVFQTPSGISSWSGTGPPTTLLARNSKTSVHLLSAGSDGGRLSVAYTSYVQDDTHPDRQNQVIVAVGDAHGRNLHRASSVYLTAGMAGAPSTIFTPSGVVAITSESIPGSSTDAARVFAAVLPG